MLAARQRVPGGAAAATSGPLANNKSLYKTMPFDSQKDLTPIALVGEIPLVIVSSPAVKAGSLKDFVALAKANPAQYSVGHPGNGTIGHLALEYFKTTTGSAPQSVPYKGDTPAMTDLLGGQIQAISAPVSAFIPNIQGGKLTGLAVTSKKRFPGLPNVPTTAEAGLKGFELEAWIGIFAPAATPADVVAKLSAQIKSALELPETKTRADGAGVEARIGCTRCLNRGRFGITGCSQPSHSGLVA